VSSPISRWRTLAVGKTGKVNPRQEPTRCNLMGLDTNPVCCTGEISMDFMDTGNRSELITVAIQLDY
jgi:hypothetical protein